jgi:hypothetical protein
MGENKILRYEEINQQGDDVGTCDNDNLIGSATSHDNDGVDNNSHSYNSISVHDISSSFS